MTEKLINKREFTEILGCGKTYFETHWMKHPVFPKPLRIYSNKLSWKLSEAQNFLDYIIEESTTH